MKKYLLIFILSTISFVTFSQIQSHEKIDFNPSFSLKKLDSIYYKHTLKINFFGEVSRYFNLGYEYRWNKKNAVEFYFERHPFNTNKQYQLLVGTFLPNEGYTTWFFYQFDSYKIRLGYKRYYFSNLFYQINFGYSEKTLRNSYMSFGKGDERDYWGLRFDQIRNEFSSQIVTGYMVSLKQFYLNLYFGGSLKNCKVKTNYLEVWNTTNGYSGRQTGYERTKILQDNGTYLIPSLTFGFQIGLQFCKKEIH